MSDKEMAEWIRNTWQPDPKDGRDSFRAEMVRRLWAIADRLDPKGAP